MPEWSHHANLCLFCVSTNYPTAGSLLTYYELQAKEQTHLAVKTPTNVFIVGHPPHKTQ